jgi:hypothetical protein
MVYTTSRALCPTSQKTRRNVALLNGNLGVRKGREFGCQDEVERTPRREGRGEVAAADMTRVAYRSTMGEVWRATGRA